MKFAKNVQVMCPVNTCWTFNLYLSITIKKVQKQMLWTLSLQRLWSEKIHAHLNSNISKKVIRIKTSNLCFQVWKWEFESLLMCVWVCIFVCLNIVKFPLASMGYSLQNSLHTGISSLFCFLLPLFFKAFWNERCTKAKNL